MSLLVKLTRSSVKRIAALSKTYFSKKKAASTRAEQPLQSSLSSSVRRKHSKNSSHTPAHHPRTQTTMTRLTSKSIAILLRTVEAKAIYFRRFPFFAADVLASNVTILQAITEGGWSAKKEEESDQEDKKSDKSGDDTFDNDRSENQMVQSILNKQSENSVSENSY